MVAIESIRNVAFISQSSTGKSSLIAHLLMNEGIIPKIPRKEEAHLNSDYTPEEKIRRFTHMTKVFSFPYKNFYFNLIDTPGYPDFVGEVIGSLNAVESIVLVIDATGSIEAQTEKTWKIAQEKNLPHLIFINKMDREEADLQKAIKELKDKLGGGLIPVQVPKIKEKPLKGLINLIEEEEGLSDEVLGWREKLMESIAETDDALLEKYLRDGKLTSKEIKEGLGKGIKDGKISLLLCGSAYSGIGVDSLAQFFIDFFPHPLERKLLDKGGEEIDIDKRKEPLAQVFKIISEPHLGEMVLFRVFSGKLSSNSSVYNSSQDVEEKFGQIQLIQGQKKKR